MEAEKINKKSLYQKGGNLNSPDSNALIESLSEEIQQRVKIGEPAETILYSYLEQGIKQEQLALAFESVGYDPNAFVALMQSTEEMVNNQMQNVENTQQTPQDIEQPPQQIMEEIPKGIIPPMQYGGDMFSNLFMFGDALNDAFGDITNWKSQKNQYEKGKRHKWEVDFKGADVNPEDYYVTSQGELRNFKEDKKKKKVDRSLFPSSIDLVEGEAIETMEDNKPYIESFSFPKKKVGNTYFKDWLDANKPKIKDLPFEESLKREDNPFGMNYNPFAINQKIKSVQPQGPTEMGEDGPIKKPSMLRTGMEYGGYFQEGGESYTVKSGDVLSQIAIDNNIALEDILNANPGLKPDKIQIGQSLVLPKQINDLQNTAKKASKKINGASDKLKKQREKNQNKLYNDLKSKYIKDLMIQENASKDGWDEEKQLWFPIKAPEGKEGNLDDIGFGYKMSPKEKKAFKNGITNEKLMSLTNKVLKEKEQVAKNYFNNENYSVNWNELNPKERILLTDYAYNGVIGEFPKFLKAVANQDKATMLKEYERFSDGKPLTERNKWTKKYIEDNFKYGGNLKKYQFAGSVPILPRVNPIPNQSFSNIEPIDFIGGSTQFNTANANTFINPMNTSNPMGPTGIPGGASGHYYRGNIGPGSGMGAINFENMSMEDLRNQYINSQKPIQNTNSEFPSSIDLEGGQFIEDLESGMYDWQAGEDAGAWDQNANQDPTVKRKRTVGTAMSNAENWLKNNPTSRAIGNAANIIKTGAGVISSGLNAFNVMDAQADQKKRMSAEAVAGISQGNRGQQDLNTGLFIEDKDIYGMSKYGSELYKNGGNIKNWFEQNNIPRAQEGMELEIDNDTLAALIAAGADIEML